MADRAGIMAPLDGLNQKSEMMDILRSTFGPSSSEPPTLQEELEALSEDKLKLVLRIAPLVKWASSWNPSEPYHVLVERMYKRLDTDTKRLVAAILQDADPVEEPVTPSPDTRAAAINKAYSEYQKAFDLIHIQTVQNAKAQTDAATMDDFMRKMAMSESSGDPSAKITLEDGRTFTGLYQLGDARLSDYRKATGAKFTTAEFKQDEALQQKVADWHFQDLADAIEALGSEADGYDRVGLMAVAHLSGIGGMRKFVRSGGTHNPSDALGTSAQDYYNKFAT